MSEVRIIKKYGNRKLYDTKESKYVTLSYIFDYVRQGNDIQVIHNGTKQDVTSEVLFNALVEKNKNIAIPPENLTAVIRKGNGTLFDYITGGN